MSDFYGKLYDRDAMVGDDEPVRKLAPAWPEPTVPIYPPPADDLDEARREAELKWKRARIDAIIDSWLMGRPLEDLP